MFKKAILAVAVAGFCFISSPAQAYTFYTPEWEAFNSDAFYNSAIRRAGRHTDEQAQANLKAQADRIIVAAGENPANYRVTLTQENGFNAYNILGKSVMVGQDVAIQATYAERDFVLAHEIAGHAAHEDVLEVLDSKAQTQFYGNLLLDLFVSQKPITDQQRYAFAFKFLQNQYLKGNLGRQHEENADKYGFQAVARLVESGDKRANVGAELATFARFKIIFANGHNSGLLGFVNSILEGPDEHPAVNSRYNSALKRLEDYSNNRLTVKNNNQIWVDNKFLKSAQATQDKAGRNIPAGVQAALEAGTLAKYAHTGQLPVDRADMLALIQ